jgi:hypothetical protein
VRSLQLHLADEKLCKDASDEGVGIAIREVLRLWRTVENGADGKKICNVIMKRQCH